MSNQVRNKLIKIIEGEIKILWEKEQRTINQYPEYYLSVKVAEKIKIEFSSLSFTMEERAIDLIEDLNETLMKSNLEAIDVEEQDDCFRLEKGAVDLILKKRKRLRHIVEFKRNSKLSDLMDDALRLAWFCCNAPLGHRAETNYLVVITHKSEETLEKNIQKIEDDLTKNILLPNIQVKSFYLDFPDDYFSTRRSSKQQSKYLLVVGRLIEFKYKE